MTGSTDAVVDDGGADAMAICAGDALADGGDGVRFPVMTRDGPSHGFVIRFRGIVHGYLDRCAHAGVELDWEPGRFFDRSGLYLFCATHGAVYAPDSGRCAGGPCRGQGLRVIAVSERDGTIFWSPDRHVFPVGAPLPR